MGDTGDEEVESVCVIVECRSHQTEIPIIVGSRSRYSGFLEDHAFSSGEKEVQDVSMLRKSRSPATKISRYRVSSCTSPPVFLVL